MIDTPSDILVTADPGEPTSPPKVPTESPPPVGDPEGVVNSIMSSHQPSIVPAPLKI